MQCASEFVLSLFLQYALQKPLHLGEVYSQITDTTEITMPILFLYSKVV